MRHLVWETVPFRGKQCCRHPSHEVVTVDSLTQRACVCPHFAWKQGPPPDFLLSDMLNSWPDLRCIPHDAQKQQQQPAAAMVAARAAARVAATAAAAAAATAAEALREALQTPCTIAVRRMILCLRYGRPVARSYLIWTAFFSQTAEHGLQ